MTQSELYSCRNRRTAPDRTLCLAGDMISELKAKDWILEFVSGGPKNYAYKVCNSLTREMKTVCKVRGITLNYNASQLLNLDTIKYLILNCSFNSIVMVHTHKKIKRKIGDGACITIVTEPEDKIYSVSFYNRVRLDDNSLYPLGINKPVAWQERHFD